MLKEMRIANAAVCLHRAIEAYKNALDEYYEKSKIESPTYGMIESPKIEIANAILTLLSIPTTPKNWCIEERERKEYELRRFPPLPDGYEGFVYLLSGSNGSFKIGKSKNLKDRVVAIRGQVPFGVEFVHAFPAKDYGSSEAVLHDRYKDKRDYGEWFKLSPNQVAEIIAIKSM